MQARGADVPDRDRNAGEVMWRGAQGDHAGTVEWWCVLRRWTAAGWRVETITEHVAQVRDMFTDTLAHWPGRPVAPGDGPAGLSR